MPEEAPGFQTKIRLLVFGLGFGHRENVRFGSLADILTSPRHVRFALKSGHGQSPVGEFLQPTHARAACPSLSAAPRYSNPNAERRGRCSLRMRFAGIAKLPT